jgi:hypothetical protein
VINIPRRGPCNVHGQLLIQAGRTFLVPPSARLFRIASHTRKRLNLQEFGTTLPLVAARHVKCTCRSAISLSSASARLAIRLLS